MRKSELEKLFNEQVDRLRLPEPIYEYSFAKSVGRRHRFDAAWPKWHIAVELQGFVAETVRLENGERRKCVTSGHFSIARMQDDLDKLNMATLLGWRTVMLTEAHLKTGEGIAVVQRILAAHGWDGTHRTVKAEPEIWM